jgi:hypothetical protein
MGGIELEMGMGMKVVGDELQWLEGDAGSPAAFGVAREMMRCQSHGKEFWVLVAPRMPERHAFQIERDLET